ncbi:MAG: InlB B-repeat-containing protein [Erysipelotrichaceae bacterium]|nr:InlB B-repeat-containing protein [Erysipelotrichaceae bacterium]
MKAGLLKIFLSAALTISFAAASGLAEVIPVKAVSDESRKLSRMPSDPIVQGTDGVKWAIDANMVLYFEAGRLGTEGNWSRDFSSQINEIRVIPNEKYSRLILPAMSAGLFMGFGSLTEIDTDRFDTSEVFTMEHMFSWCSSLKELDLSSFDTRSVSNMRSLFSDCRSLERLDLSSFDTANLRNLGCYEMFSNCFALNTVSLSRDFFKGNMSCGCPYSEETKWVPFSDPDHARTWWEMNEGWDDEGPEWYRVHCSRLDLNTDGGTEIDSLYERTGSIVDLTPFIPARTGYGFTGWYLDPECTEKADDAYLLKSDSMLYAGWQIENRMLTFDTKGGAEMDPVFCPYGNMLDLNDYVPKRPDYRFTGWHTDARCLNRVENTILMNSDRTLYAGWSANPFYFGRWPDES